LKISQNLGRKWNDLRGPVGGSALAGRLPGYSLARLTRLNIPLSAIMLWSFEATSRTRYQLPGWRATEHAKEGAARRTKTHTDGHSLGPLV
jgi:hypothetical protein